MLIISTLGLEDKYRKQLEEKFPQYEIKHVARIADLDENTLKEAEVLFTYGDNMPEGLVDKMTSLKWVHVGQSGVENIPKKVLAKHQVVMTNSRGINAVNIAEYVMCMLLNIERNNYKFYEAFKRREWDMNTHLDEAFHKTITIFGIGKAGSEIAKRAKAFGMVVYGIDPMRKEDPNTDKIFLPENRMEVIPKSDVIVISMPLTNQTRNMFTKKEFDAMKPTVIFMNVGRGPIVNQTDFIEAMKEKKIGHAVMDVFDEEPLGPESELWDLENIMITPHIAGDRQASYQPNMMHILTENLRRYPDFSNMINPVNLGEGF